MQPTKNEKARKAVGLILLCGGLALLIAMSAMTVSAIGRLADDYRKFAEADLTEDFSAALLYDDRVYAQMAYGIEILSADPEKAEQLEAFLDTAPAMIYDRILAVGVLYAMLASAAGALFLYHRWGKNAKKHTAAILLYPLLLYAVFFAAVFAASAVHQIPFPALPGKAVAFLALCLACVIAGECALGLLLRVIKFKIVVGLAAVPLAIALFIFGTGLEGRLFCAPYTESFSYVAETVPEDYTGEFYYDEQKNVVILDGREYPPQQAPNEDCLTGAKKAGAIAFEALVPVSGNGIELIREEAELEIPVWALCLYALKALCWIAACALIPAKRKEDTPAEVIPAEA
ncbi:MAG: hypothetical protein IJK89_10475 [Clostridia bacterium]|nr:hypothetical protein [Clostridia bacterium]